MRSQHTRFYRALTMRCAVVRRTSVNMRCAALATFLFLCVPTARASLINFDPDGNNNPNGSAGSDPAALTGSFQFLSGNILLKNLGDATSATLPNAPQAITYYMQARLGALRDGQNNPITNHLNQYANSTLFPNYEITLVLGEDATVAKTTTGGTITGVGTSNKFFRLYYDSTPASQADDYTGSGFNDGTLILAGTISQLTGTYILSGDTPNFDTFNPNHYTGKTTDHVIGGAALTASNFTTVNPAFFQVAPSSLSLSFLTSSLATPFNTVDPSQNFTNAGGGQFPSNAFDGTGGNPNLNGVNSDFQVLADSSASFTVVVPEPSTLVLGGLGLLGFIALARRRRTPSLLA